MHASGAIFIIHFLVKQTFAKRVQLFKKLSISLLVIKKWGAEILAISKSYVLSGADPIGLKQLARFMKLLLAPRWERTPSGGKLG